MDENTPLVVPEVNEGDLHKHNGIIANPNCSTIQMVVALEPIRKAYGLKKSLYLLTKLCPGPAMKRRRNCTARQRRF